MTLRAKSENEEKCGKENDIVINTALLCEPISTATWVSELAFI